jgi:hypothetical protein
MLRNILNKYNANNLQELSSTIFRKLRKDDVPDEEVAKIVEKQVLSPRMFEFQDILEKNRLADMLPYE